MLPTTSSNLTYDDVFRLLRERHMPNTSSATKPAQGQENKQPESINDENATNKDGQTENKAEQAVDPKVAQQMQLLLMLRLLGKLPLDNAGTALNPTNKQNVGVSLTQNENEPQKKTQKAKMPLQSSLAINVDKKKEGKSNDISSVVKTDNKLKDLDLDTQNEDPSLSGIDPKSKKIRKMNMCGHPERAHYAKNMCNQCYHKHGRTKKPWRCNHERLYAHGLCQNCYINAYNKKRSLKSKEDEPSATPSMELEGEGITSSASPRSIPSGNMKEEDGSSSFQAENEGTEEIESSTKGDNKDEKVEIEEDNKEEDKKIEEKDDNKEEQK